MGAAVFFAIPFAIGPLVACALVQKVEWDKNIVMQLSNPAALCSTMTGCEFLKCHQRDSRLSVLFMVFVTVNHQLTVDEELKRPFVRIGAQKHTGPRECHRISEDSQSELTVPGVAFLAILPTM